MDVSACCSRGWIEVWRSVYDSVRHMGSFAFMLLSIVLSPDVLFIFYLYYCSY